MKLLTTITDHKPMMKSLVQYQVRDSVSSGSVSDKTINDAFDDANRTLAGVCRLMEPILKEPLRVEKGMALADEVLGIGLIWNETAIEIYTV